ncbi:Rhodanese- sulfurtransferase [Chamberlinius hualienensis]
MASEMGIDVDEILKNSQNKYKSIEVKKNLDLDIDLGNLLAFDNNVLDAKQYRPNINSFLKELARDNTQLVINKIWELPHERREDAVVVQLPPPRTRVPREKPLPKAAPLTKWEEYAKAKGIQKRNKTKKVWDEGAKEWKPRWGYRRGDDNTKDWLIEVPGNADPYEDQFDKRKNDKKERVAKNEFQRLRNIAKANKVKVPHVGVTPTDNLSKDEVSRALTLAKSSTASIGKFTENLPTEKPPKNSGRKRKFEPLFADAKAEKQKNLAILKNIRAKKPKLDVEKAVNTEMLQENLANRNNERKSKKGPTKKRGGGKGKRMKGRNMKGGKGKQGGKNGRA